MESLQLTFIVLKWCGLWRPAHRPPSYKTKLYAIYTCFMMLLLVTISFSQFIELLTSDNDIDGLVNNTFFLLIIGADCGKAINILIKRDDIFQLTNCLHQDPCQPKTEEELAIQRKYDRIVRFNTLRYAGVVWTAVIVALVSSLVNDVPRKVLPYKTWMPFDYGESSLRFSFVYIHQVLAICFGAAVSVAFDTLILALMLQTCAQLNILMHRFDKMPNALIDMIGHCNNTDDSNLIVRNAEAALLSHRVRHHIAIFKFAKKSNDLFGIMICIQYATSTFVLCASLLRLSKEKLFSSAFTESFVYLIEMSIQILVYCFYGGDVTIESLKVSDAIYEMDWPALSTRARRSLLMIMARTLRPIKFTTAHVINLDLESFKSLVKFSYSTYNVL